MIGMGEKEKALMQYIDMNAEIWSLLYDLDLLPEQVMRPNKDWERMIKLAWWHREKTNRNQ